MFGTADTTPCTRALGMLVPIFLTISFVFIAVGIGLPYWIRSGSTDFGLFQICEENSTISSCSFSLSKLETLSENSIDLWRACIALAITSAVLVLVAEILLFSYPCMKVVNHGKISLGICICCLSFAGACILFILVGLMVRKASVSVGAVTDISLITPDYLGWALFVAGVGGATAIITGIVFAIHLFLAVYY